MQGCAPRTQHCWHTSQQHTGTHTCTGGRHAGSRPDTCQNCGHALRACPSISGSCSTSSGAVAAERYPCYSTQCCASPSGTRHHQQTSAHNWHRQHPDGKPAGKAQPSRSCCSGDILQKLAERGCASAPGTPATSGSTHSRSAATAHGTPPHAALEGVGAAGPAQKPAMPNDAMQVSTHCLVLARHLPEAPVFVLLRHGTLSATPSFRPCTSHGLEARSAHG